MKKINKQLLETLETEREALANAITKLNEDRQALEDRLTDLASMRDELALKIENIVDDMELYYGDMSERWQEGNAGQQYDEWKGIWSSYKDDLDGLELDALSDRDLDGPEELPVSDVNEV